MTGAAGIWQHVVVALAAAAAVAWLVRDVRRRRAAKAACDKCALVRPDRERGAG